MFAPPSAPSLSRAEIQRRLAAQRVEHLDKHHQRNGASPSPSRRQQQNVLSTQRNRNEHASQGLRFPSPPRTPPPRTPPPPTPHEQAERRGRANPGPGAVKRTMAVFEEPRRAPLPPKRPPRPSSELFLPPMPETPKHGRVAASRPQRIEDSGLLPPPPPVPAPPIPERSPLRNVLAIKREDSKSSLSPRPLFSGISSRSGTPPTTTGKAPQVQSVSGSIVSHASSIRSKGISRPSPQLTEATFNAALAKMKARSRRESESSESSQSSASVDPHPGVLIRSSTAPPSLDRAVSLPLLKTARSATYMGNGPRSPLSPTMNTRHAKKPSARSLDSHLRVRAASNVRAALLVMEGKRMRRTDAVQKTEKPPLPPAAQSKGKRRKKGETMSMLLDDGFFPVEEIIYNKNKKPVRPPSILSYRLNLPPRLSFIERHLPNTPSTTMSTPTEVYQSPSTPRSRARNRTSGGSTRSPLSHISEGNGDDSDARGFRKDSEQISPTRLAAIPEDSATNDDLPGASDVAKPVATQIHLRGGSIVTVTPPELTAWQQSIYIHGPIKLPTPSIMPRKDSIASHEPFQEAIDQVYQHALMIPRRRSDDIVTDDICDFFDDFGFEMVSFDGDRLAAVVGADADELETIKEMELEGEVERFSTPPPEQPSASPVEVIIAKEVVEGSSKQVPAQTPIIVPQVVAPPIETEETLRARGIARLSRGSANSVPMSERKESLSMSKEGNSLPLLPPPEESMLDAVLQPAGGEVRDSFGDAANYQSSRQGRDSMSYATSTHSSRFGKDNSSMHSSSVNSSQIGAGGQGMEWDDDVEEMDAGTTWVGPVPAAKKPGMGKGLTARKTRNPVAKMRRLVATASTIL